MQKRGRPGGAPSQGSRAVGGQLVVGVGELAGRAALVVRRDLDGQIRVGRVGRRHFVLQWNRDVVVPS